MNYSFSLSHYVMIFILLGSVSFATVPKVQAVINQLSDSYVRSEMNKIRGEIMFMNARALEFKDVCYSGFVYSSLENIIRGYSQEVSCRTNRPDYNELMICAHLKNGNYTCTDGQGVSCELLHQPKNYHCKLTF